MLGIGQCSKSVPSKSRWRLACWCSLFLVFLKWSQCSTIHSWAIPRATRRNLVTGTIASSVPCNHARALDGIPSRVRTRLDFERGAFYLDIAVEGGKYRVVLDSGSPFALVGVCSGQRKAQGRCDEYCGRYGCAVPSVGQSSGLEENVVVFSGARTKAAWRKGQVQIGGVAVGETTFGVLSEVQSYGGNAGGPNFGLIREASNDPAIRPTFLSQTPYRAIKVDLKEPGKETLELSETMPLDPTRMIGLANLTRYGAPVTYYAVEVKALLFDGVDALKGRDVVAVLDTGTTGLALPQDLFSEFRTRRYETAVRATHEGRYEAAEYGNVEVHIEGIASGRTCLRMLRGPQETYNTASFDVVTAIPSAAGSIFYRAEQKDPGMKRPKVIFVGLGFLLGRCLTIDMAARALTLT